MERVRQLVKDQLSRTGVPGYFMPEHFRFKLSCKECPAGLDADGHNSMSCLDAYLSGHIAAFGHTEYNLTIRL